MPFCRLQIKALRSPYPDNWITTQAVPTDTKTIGDHIRRRRLTLHILQKDLARQLGVNIETLKNWERNAFTPMVNHLPRIIEFLGYDPQPIPDMVPARIAYGRRQLGLSQERLAEILKIDPVTLYRWEKGLSVPSETKLAQIKALLDASATR